MKNLMRAAVMTAVLTPVFLFAVACGEQGTVLTTYTRTDCTNSINKEKPPHCDFKYLIQVKSDDPKTMGEVQEVEVFDVDAWKACSPGEYYPTCANVRNS